MQLDESKAKRIECFCSRHPLLAMFLADDSSGRPVIWVKTIKNGHISTEVILTVGSIRVRCRECLRFHRIDLWPDKKLTFDRVLEDSADFRE